MRLHISGLLAAAVLVLAAVPARAVGAFFHSPQRLFNRLKNLGVGLFELERDMNFVVAAGLIRHVPLAGVVFHRSLQRLDAARAEDFSALLEERVLENLLVHWL